MTPEERAKLEATGMDVIDGPTSPDGPYVCVISKHKPKKEEYFYYYIDYVPLPGGTRTRDECRYCGYSYCERPCPCGLKGHCDNTHPCKYCQSTDCGLFEKGVFMPRCQLCDYCYHSSHSTEDCPKDCECATYPEIHSPYSHPPICNICKLGHKGKCLVCTWCQMRGNMEFGHVIEDCPAWHRQLDLVIDTKYH
jgi:hypothetical protein